MNSSKLKQALSEIKKGNEMERERLIRHYKPYIINTVSHICKRYVTWDSDEMSIGLIAFNRAIDTFDWGRGRTFLNYVYLLIHNDLIDYFRKENQQRRLAGYPLSEMEGNEINKVETEASIDGYQRSKVSASLVEEILELNENLHAFNISFEELEDHSPKHRDTRIMVNDMATRFIQDEELVKELFQRKLFPVAAFSKKTGYRRKTVERYRKYLIAVIIIMVHTEWTHLSSYVQAVPGGVER